MAYPLDNIAGGGDADNITVSLSTDLKYIPTLYAGKLLVKFYEASVLGEIANSDYEGMIRDQGDTVIIRTLPTITINDHRKGMTVTNQEPTSTPVTLLIDKGKYWSFRTDDPDDVQTDVRGWINEWTEEASYALRNAIEISVLQSVYATAGIHKGANQGAQSADFNLGEDGAPVTVTKDTIVDQMVDCGTILDESNVPDEGRYFLLPPKLVGMIKKSELKDASLAGDSTSIVRNGLVGMIDRFKLFKTGNLKYDSDDKAWYTLFGTKHALTFASQLVKNKVIDNPNGFGMLHRGLHVYGFKVVKADAMGTLYATAG